MLLKSLYKKVIKTNFRCKMRKTPPDKDMKKENPESFLCYNHLIYLHTLPGHIYQGTAL